MRISFDGVENVTGMLDEFRNGLAAKAARGIARGCKEVEAEAKARCPVSTEATRPGGPHGELRASINTQTEGLSGTVGTNKEYAMYVEFGTCKMAAQPYLVPSLAEKAPEVIRIVKEEISS